MPASDKNSPLSEDARQELNRSLGVRLAAAMEGKLTATDAARLVGVDPKTIRRWIAGTSGADIAGVLTIARYLGIPGELILTGEVTKPERQLRTAEERADAAKQREVVDVPVIDVELSAGPGRSATIGHVGSWASFPWSWLRSLGDPVQMELVRIVGDSAEPELRDGDYALVDRSQTRPSGLMAVRLFDELLVKRVGSAGSGRVQLLSPNPAYPPRVVEIGEAADAQIIGKVVWGGRTL